MLYQLGALQFQVAPFNVHEVTLQTGADFAAKDVVGMRRPREFVGEADSQLTLIGRLFPSKFGGLADLKHLQNMQAKGIPYHLTRGGGPDMNMEWWTIERVTERSTLLDRNGIGQVIEVEIVLMRSEKATAAQYARVFKDMFSRLFD
jgi:phage protein U